MQKSLVKKNQSPRSWSQGTEKGSIKMKTQIATVSKVISVSAEKIYNLIADYRNGHPRILPKEYFLSLDVEEGGFGAGTIVQFQMRLLGRTQSFRSIITEPDPGRVLVETDIVSGIPTSFIVESVGGNHHARLTISTELKDRNMIEGFIAKIMLQKVYRRELDLVAKVAENHASDTLPVSST
jgi:hypothetical protein